jgi:hypothetical protein
MTRGAMNDPNLHPLTQPLTAGGGNSAPRTPKENEPHDLSRCRTTSPCVRTISIVQNLIRNKIRYF